MAIKKFNSIDGFSVGSDTPISVIDNSANVTANNLVVSATTDLGNIGNIRITGGNSGYVLKTDGAGNLSWGVDTATAGGANGYVQFNDSGTLAGNSNFTFNKTTSILTITGNIVATNANLGNLVTANYFSGNGAQITGLTIANSLTDVLITSATNGQLLGYNGVNWVNVDNNPSVGAGPGTGFWFTGPVIQATSANNNIQIDTLANTPNVSTQFYASSTINGTGVLNISRTGSLGRSIFDAGNWDFSLWANVSSTGGTSTIGAGIYETIPYTAGTITMTGTGTTRTATASTGTPFANVTPGSNVATSSYLETSLGIYRITAKTSSTVVSIDVPTTYVNQSAVTGYVYNPIWTAGTVQITSTTLSEYLLGTSEDAHTLEGGTNSGLGIVLYATTSASKTLYIALNGQQTASHVATPLHTLHDDLAGLQGGQSNEYYHLTQSEYTGTGTGIFVRQTNANLTTPNIGTATGTSLTLIGNLVSGNASLGNSATANYFTGTLTTSSQPNITSLGTLGNLTVSGNITSGNVNGGNLVYANYFTGVITSNNQPYIESLGNLVNLTVSNIYGKVDFITTSNVSLGNISNLHILGGNAGYVLKTDGAGNLSWGVDTTAAAGSNTYVQFNDGNSLGASSNFTFNKGTSVLTVTGNIIANNANLGNNASSNYFTGNGSLLSSLTGSNVVGNVNWAITSNYANTANSVSGSNVNGNVNWAITSNYANTANNVAGANVTGQVGNALIAGTVYTNSQPNITSVGTLTSLTVSGNITAGNVSGGNLVSANYISGNGSLLSSITGSNVVGNVNWAITSNYANTANNVAGANVTGQVGNALVAGTVYTNAQPNITSVGTLTSLTVSGNISAGNVSGGNLVSANYISGNGSLLSSITGGNVTGQVANALIAGTVYTNAQPNITSVGTLSNLAIAGTGSITGANLVSANYITGTLTTASQPNITSVGTLSNINVSGDALITGNLTVSGTTEYTNVTNLYVKDPIIELGGGANNAPLTNNDGKDRGTLLHYYTSKTVDAFMGWDNSNSEFGFGSNVSVTNEVVTWNSYGNIRAGYFIGDGSLLTNLNAGNLVGAYGNSNVANYLPTYTGNVSANYFIGNGSTITYITGANVNGNVPYASTSNYANTANSISGSNVNGNVNWAITSNYANTANSISGSNVNGNVNWAITSNYANTANSINGSNVNGNVNWAITSNYANTANSVSGSNVSGNVDYAITSNYANTANSISGSNVSGNVNWAITSNYANTANSVSGSNVSGQVANALIAGTVYTNSQPNITSLGTLTDLTVDGLTNLGPIGNVTITGGISGYVLTTNGSGDLSWQAAGGSVGPGFVNITKNSFTGNGVQTIFTLTTTPASEASLLVNIDGITQQDAAYSLSGSNVTFASAPLSGEIIEIVSYGSIGIGSNSTVLFNDNGDIGNVSSFTFDKSANLLSVTNIAANGAGITYITGSNVFGNVSSAVQSHYANIANNVSGSNITGQVSNALVAGTVYTNSQPNITSVGTLTSLSVAGNVDITGNINVTGNLNYSNVTDLVVGDPLIYIGANNTGNLYDLGIVASYNDGTYYHTGLARDASDGLWKFFDRVVAEPTTIIDFANGVYANIGVGSLVASGNITSANASLGNLVVANYFSGDGSLLTNLNSSNIGNVGNANYSNFAGTAYSISGSNVSGNVNYAITSNYANTANSINGSNVNGNVNWAITSNYANTANSINGSNVSGNVNWAITSNYANTANSISGSNVSGNVNWAITSNYANTANSISGSNVSGNVNDAIHAYYADVANSISGSNVSGQVANALIAGTVYTNSQPNITSVGTLTGLSVSNNSGIIDFINTSNVSLGNISNLHILGGNAGYVLKTDGAGNLSWGVDTTAAGGSNTNIQFNDGGSLSGSNSFTFDKGTSVLTLTGNLTTYNANLGNLVNANYFAGNGSLLTNITGANVTGQVANAVIAGTVYTNSQPNITSVGTLTSLDVTGNVNAANAIIGSGSGGSITGANLVSANYISGDGSLLTNLTGSNVSGQVSNALIAGTVYTNSQPNITSLGDLTGLTVSNNTGLINFVNTSNVSLGDVSNLHITGGNAGYVLTTDGYGQLSWEQSTSGGSGFVSIRKDNFTGNGVQTTFNLSSTPSGQDAVEVNLNGLIQQSYVYNVVGSSVVFTSPPPANANIEVTSYGALSLAQSDTQILYINGSNLSGSNNFTFTQSNNTLSVDNIVSIANVTAGNILTNNFLYANGNSYIFTGGSNTQVQFNDNNVFGGTSNFTFNKYTNTLSVTNIDVTTVNFASGLITVSGSNAGIFSSGVNNINLGLAANVTVGSSSGNTTVQGNLVTTNINTSGNLAVSNTASVTNLKVNDFYSNRTPVSVTTNTIVDSFSVNKYRSAKYTMRINSDDGYQAVEVLLIHDGTDSYVTIYGSLSTIGTDIINLSSNIDSGNVRLLATTVSANTTVNLLGTYVAD